MELKKMSLMCLKRKGMKINNSTINIHNNYLYAYACVLSIVLCLYRYSV